MIDYAKRYAPFPALIRAIGATRQARIVATAERNPTTLYYLETAEKTERKLRLALAPAMRVHKEALAYDKAHRKRYHWQMVTNKSRTIAPATELRQARALARAQARAGAIAKRANNRRK